MPEQNQQQDPPAPQEDKKPCSPPGDTQYKKAKEAYLKTIDDKIKELEIKRFTKKVIADSKSVIACNVRKSVTALRDTSKEYNFLENCIVLYQTKDLDILSKVTKKDIHDKSEAFKTSFAEMVKILKATKIQLGAVNDLARKLGDALNESCNSEEVKHLRQCFTKNNWKPDLDQSVKDIVRLAQRVNDQVDDLSESSVETAGINGFINVGSLEIFIDDIKRTGDAFTTNVKNTVQNLQKESQNAVKTLTTTLEELSTSIQEKYTARTDKEVWEETRRVVGQDFPDECKNVIKELVEEAARCFEDNNPGA